MVKVIRRFFDFCGETNRKKFVTSIWLGVLIALFEALKIPAIAVMMRALLPVSLGGNGGITAQDILMSVYQALQAKGYDPITQIVGYIISGDPTYITSHNQARSMICRLERDEILEEMVRFYIEKHHG